MSAKKKAALTKLGWIATKPWNQVMFVAQKDITVYELALIVPFLHGKWTAKHAREEFTKLPIDVSRHFIQIK